MKITIISVGKKPRGAEAELIDEYIKRISKPWEISWKFIGHADGSSEQAKTAESSAILNSISDTTYVLLLDERGRTLSNQLLAEQLDPAKQHDVAIIIGGAYGVDERVRERATTVANISGLILPHKLVRVLVAEQLYRTQCILQGHPYHHQ